MAMVLACASMLFSTNSAMALSGLLCDSAMMRMAFQSSPIRNLPLSDSFDLAALVFATVILNSQRLSVECKAGMICRQQPLYRGPWPPGTVGRGGHAGAARWLWLATEALHLLRFHS